jgi:hypothetical protein
MFRAPSLFTESRYLPSGFGAVFDANQMCDRSDLTIDSASRHIYGVSLPGWGRFKLFD